MQEFLLNNTVNCNLMSLTGYRTLVILDLLLDSPKSTDEINECFLNNPYIKEKFSNDTLRIYINSLRAIGCEITRANKSNKNKYELISHPFNFDITKPQLKALKKIYKIALDSVNILDILEIENLFEKIAEKVQNEKTLTALKDMSVLKNINKPILKELINYCKTKSQIIIKYRSPASGDKQIEILCDKLDIKSEKLYLWGHSINHNEYAFFRLDKIIEINAVKLKKDITEQIIKTGVVEISTKNNNYIPDKNERIIKKENSSLWIEIDYKNEFELFQKLLFLANECKITSPEKLKTDYISYLKEMKESYN